MDKAKVKQLVEEAINENPSLFLIELSFLANNKIYVEIDGDNGVPLKECIRVSRNVEHNLDREEEDFELEVTTPDITKPIQNIRQYKKNLDRNLEVKFGEDEQKVEGKLVSVDEDSITLEWKAREPKPIGKGKVTVVKNATILYSDIHQAKVKINFN
ncbi:ribosome assembly cofactor RimP [Aureivirga marina]|uniref:ribosome assembly cofactor RimP n=1 Tax=Aureivirga marina TaxID=1182451 RepID=UPI0018CA5E69|nr:ribosome assembly cofactor RimP [Aureivirga marina]